ncbi:hypothetical protein NUU61_004118 [Penicillium alfredii]|uniref:Glycosyltransferase family 8 protein n=1 Tax=Penicillium alfredii TaxID=1506179 RepID=A0A9W9KDI4_9EURO|nr:uncharacterized protein NUU61_004118 [Penicillium alfredii]KAJ5101896.1 hypothetical protein NUU61_004118 [Penicillium alfredii]
MSFSIEWKPPMEWKLPAEWKSPAELRLPAGWKLPGWKTLVVHLIAASISLYLLVSLSFSTAPISLPSHITPDDLHSSSSLNLTGTHSLGNSSAGFNASTKASPVASPISSPSASPSPLKSRYAIGTFLGAHWDKKEGDTDYSDWYFVGARILTYQFMHSPITKLKTPIPFIILVSKDVSESKRERLRRDGATVVEVEHIQHNFSDQIGKPSWKETFTKMRLFDPKVMPYEKVLMVDTDMVITRPIDNLFLDRNTALQPSRRNGTKEQKSALLSHHRKFPASYAYWTAPETMDWDHPFPFTNEDGAIKEFNSALAMYTPNEAIFQYYMDLIAKPDSFPFWGLPDQNLLNYAHRLDGPLPWQQLEPSWYINWVNPNDLEGEVAIFHIKYWNMEYPHPLVREYALSRRWEMEGYWLAKEGKPHAKWASNSVLGDI